MSWSCPVCSFAGNEDSSDACSCGHVRKIRATILPPQTPSFENNNAKTDIRAKVKAMLTAGAAKSEVYSQLAGHGINEHRLAYIIASYADPKRYQEHKTKTNMIIIIMLIHALLASIAGLGAGAQIGPNAKWFFAIIAPIIPLLFAWFLYKKSAYAYNTYITLSIFGLPKQVIHIAKSPQTLSIIALVVSITILTFVWYVRNKIFPDFSFIMPKKRNGKYVFSS